MDRLARRPLFLDPARTLGLQVFVFAGLLSACSGRGEAEDLALRACELVPAVSIDGVGQALARGVILEEEQALWRQAPEGAALRAIGAPGLGVLRANSTCEVLGSVSTSQSVRVDLVRTEPDLALMGDFQRGEVRDLPTRARRLALSVVATPGGARVRVELARAREELEQARGLAAAGQTAEALATFDALESWFGDPTLSWERDLIGP